MLKTAEKIENSVPEMDEFISVTADKDFIYFPNKPPKPRKRANNWRDATEEELARDTGGINQSNQNDNFFEDFMKIADKELMKNLNPTILNAL